MASPRSLLYYWDGSKWAAIFTADNHNAVIGVIIDDTLGNPRTAEITVSNRTPRPASSNAVYYKGPHTDKFSLFTPILLRDSETNQIIFMGHVYNADNSYTLDSGDVLKIKATDALEEVRAFPARMIGEEIATEDRKGIPNTSSTNTRQEQIKYMLTDSDGGMKSNILDMTDIATSNSTTNKGRARVQLSEHTFTDPTPLENRNENVLQIIAELANEDPHAANDDKNVGYDYYVDPNFTYPRPAAGNWTVPNGGTHKQEFNYHQRGQRPSAAGTLESHSLNVVAPRGSLAESGARPLTSSTDLKATRLMLPGADFSDPSESLRSHAVVTFDARFNLGVDASGAEDNNAGVKNVRRTKTFELLYVYDITLNSSTDFLWRGKKIDTNDNTTTRGVGASEYLSAYRENGSTLIAANVCAIQHQSVAGTAQGAGANTRNEIEYILVSDVASTFPTANYGSEDYIVLKGTQTGAFCKMNADSDIASSWEGRPQNAWKVKRPLRMVYETNPNDPDELRKNIASSLRRISKDVRRGQFQTVRGPYFYVEGRVVAPTSGNGTTTLTNMVLREYDSTTTIIPAVFGIKPGMTINFYGTDSTFTTQTGHGQIGIVSATGISAIHLDAALTVSTDHYFRIYVPIRAGDAVRVKNLSNGILGNHLVLQTTYSEGFSRADTTWKTIGENQDIAVVNIPGIKTGPLQTAIKATQEGSLLPDMPIGQASFTYEGGVFSNPSASVTNRVQWTSGNLNVGGGGSYTISAGDTYTQLSNSNFASSGTPVYYIYFEKGVSATQFQVILESAYKTSSNRLLIGWARYGTPKAEFGIFGAASPGQANQQVKQDAAVSLSDGSILSSLLDPSLQTTTVNLKLIPTTSISSTAHRHLKWADGSIARADGVTATILAGGDTNNDDTGSYALTSSSNIDTGGINLSVLQDNTTYFVYIDYKSTYYLGSSVGSQDGANDKYVYFTSDVSIPSVDGRILLATVLTVSGVGPAPSIIPIVAGTSLHVTADKVTANTLSAISADIGAITAGSVTGITLTGGLIQSSSSVSGGRVTITDDAISLYAAVGVGSYTGGLTFYNNRDVTPAEVGAAMKANYLAHSGSLGPWNDGFMLLSSDDFVIYLNGGSVGTIVPYVDNVIDLGQSSRQYRNGYFENAVYVNGSALSSDERIKTEIVDLTSANSLTFIDSLRPRQYKKSHFGERIKYGLIAQEVESALDGLSIDKATWGGVYIPDTETSTDTRHLRFDENGDDVSEEFTRINLHRLYMEDFIAPLIGAVKELKRRLEILESS